MVEEVQNQPREFEETREVEDEDRISMLPDCLLGEILSRLPDTKYAVRTGALSKRWKHIWTWALNLNFLQFGDPTAGFNSFVDKTLTQRGQLNLKKLTLISTYLDQIESQVRNWVLYAVNCNVKEINLSLWDPTSPQSFLLDQWFFTNSCFTDLQLTLCELNPVGAISWKNLLSLQFSNVELDEDLIENILSGSPVLETLVLMECFGFMRLDITSKSVKKLVLHGYHYLGEGDDVEINAPTILSLTVEAPLYMRKLLLLNVSSLVEAKLDYKWCGYYETNRIETKLEMLKRFILNLRHVKELKIGRSCYKVLFRLVVKGFTFPSCLKVCYDSYYDPYGSDSDSDELLLPDDGPLGDELQQ